MNNHKFYEHYDFENGKDEKFDLKFLVNQIVHSYIFSPNFEVDEESGDLILSVINFCSDDHKNKWIYEISLKNIISLFDGIGQSNITSAHYFYDSQMKDYRVSQSDDLIPAPVKIDELITSKKNKAK